MQRNILLAICSRAKYTCCVYVEGGTDIICNLGGSLLTVNDLLVIEEGAEKMDGDTYCCGQAQDSFGLDLFCKPRDLDNASSVCPCEGHAGGKFTLKIVRPESMAPLGNTMRFINCNQADFSGVDHLDESFVVESFGGYISKSSLVSIPTGR